ncbi:TPA: TraY domain-containing protein [Legionella pneumophila]|uniref:TraY domain-containing protein n=1 Tax=Legionella pneumophila TaxID=446 RepID=UPI00077774CE|nr:TraY domain-containing protein [Legionella pneumophila]HAT8623328.1 TraY domain-containing protein [Legionella pneumophila]
MELKLESNNNYKKVFITIQISEESNRFLSESAKRSNRKKVQEAKIRLEDHINRYRSISELNTAVPQFNNENKKQLEKQDE